MRGERPPTTRERFLPAARRGEGQDPLPYLYQTRVFRDTDDLRCFHPAGVVHFASQLDALPAPRRAKGTEDLAFLDGLLPTDCYYGPASVALAPFLCIPPRELAWPYSGREVLESLGVAHFRSEHQSARELDSRGVIRAPGYHPYTKNDELHTDLEQQYLFAREAEAGEERPGGADHPRTGNRARIQEYVREGRLWFLCLHGDEGEGGWARNWVTLLAVGASPASGGLVGVITAQRCHNLCD
jgi:hypothetical protein